MTGVVMGPKLSGCQTANRSGDTRQSPATTSGRLMQKLLRQEKRAACDSKRPKSREETPKEGSDSASATAPQQYAAATHQVQEFSGKFPCKFRMVIAPFRHRRHNFSKQNQYDTKTTADLTYSYNDLSFIPLSNF